MFGLGDSLAWLAGHRLHLRVTTRPYPAAQWARQLHELTPAPLEPRAWSRGRTTWSRCSTTCGSRRWRRRRCSWGSAGRRAASYRLISGDGGGQATSSTRDCCPSWSASPRPWGCPGWTDDRRRLRRWSGCCGGPSASGCRRRARLSPVGDGRWDADDLHCFRMASSTPAEPLGRTVRVTARGARACGAPRRRAVGGAARGDRGTRQGSGPVAVAHGSSAVPGGVVAAVRRAVGRGGAQGRSRGSCWWSATCRGTIAEHDLDEPLALDRQARQAREVEDQMSRGVDVAAARIHGWFRLAVSARTQEECLERVRKVTASYRSAG